MGHAIIDAIPYVASFFIGLWLGQQKGFKEGLAAGLNRAKSDAPMSQVEKLKDTIDRIQ